MPNTPKFAPYYIDSHCHLDFAAMGDIASLLQQCMQTGVAQFIVPSVDVNNWQKVLQLGLVHPQVHVALGIHPYFLSDNNHFVHLVRLATEHRSSIVAIGEIGLDGSIDVSAQQQLEILKQQLDLASELDLPIICHAHKAYDPLLKQLRRIKLTRGGVVHGFSGSLVQANEFIKLGFKLGVGGVITYARAQKTRRLFSELPLECLLLETDSPDMPLSGLQGQVNTPLNIVRIGVCLGELRQQSEADIASATTLNCQLLFNL